MCSHCHDPHSAQPKLAGNALCTQCHNTAGRADFPTLPKTDFDSAEHHHHTPGAGGAQCVSCHMADKTYMGVDDRRDHSFRIPRPDLSVALDVPNACNDCHDQESSAWARDALARWYPGAKDAHFAEVFAAARTARPEAEGALTALASDSAEPAIVRASALSLLLRYSQRGSSRALEAGLRDSHPLVRIGALRGAQRWAPEQRWRLTRKLLDDEALAVRVEAVRGLIGARAGLSEGNQQTLRPYLQSYLQTLTFNADTAAGQSSMASVYLALGDTPAAEAALQTSLQLSAQWVPALVNLADLYRGTGRDAQGGELLDRALELTPDESDVLLAKGLWLVRQGDTAGALPMFERAWLAAPVNVQNAYVYVVALHSTGRSLEALQVADETLALVRDEQLLQTAFGIARDANLQGKVQAYAEAMRNR
jgi:predicted CXXCH cytochrome family protein